MIKNNKSPFLLDLVQRWLNIQRIERVLNQDLKPSIAGIGTSFRKLIAYEDERNKHVFRNDMLVFSTEEQKQIIGAIIKGRKTEILALPFFKTLRGTPITAELRFKPFRILLYQISENDYLMLSVFKKKTDETPRIEIDKAEKRLSDYLHRYTS
jgi:phage-related protein